MAQPASPAPARTDPGADAVVAVDTSPADPPAGEVSVAVVDRTFELFDVVVDAAERAGICAVVRELDTTGFDRLADRADLVVFGPRELTAAGLKRVARYARAHPASVLVAVGVASDSATRQTLRAHGVSEVVRGAATRAKLASALGRAVDELARLQADAPQWFADRTAPRTPVDPYPQEPQVTVPEQRVDTAEAPPQGEAEPAAQPQPQAGAEPQPEAEPQPGAEPQGEPDAAPDAEVEVTTDTRLGRLITVASATGGCGKTFFSTNLAAVLASSGQRCLLVDLDLQFGEVAAALRIRHPYSVYDGLYDGEGRPLPDEALVEHLGTLVHHHPLGFDVLTAPKEPVFADYVGAHDATRVIDAVLPEYDVVIVDTPPSLNEVVLVALDRSDVVAVLATMDVPSLKNLGVLLDTLTRLRLDPSRVQLVLNKIEPDIGIDVKQAQDAFDGRFVGRIDLARVVSRSLNAGTVVVDLEPRSRVSAQIREAARAILPADLQPASETPQRSPRTSLLTRLVPRFRRRPAEAGGTS